MKLLPLIILFIGAAVTHAAEVWAPGVSHADGWVDYNKDNNDKKYMEDDGMCWAASASNVISWWQNQNAEALTSTTLPSQNAWDLFRLVYKNVGGYPSSALDWWINGITVPTDSNGYPIYPDNMDMKALDDKDLAISDLYVGGFLTSSVYSTAENPLLIANGNNNSYTFCKAMVDAMTSGYALSISASGHAFTLWGLDYKESANGIIINKAWLTDSDDYQTKLVETTLFTIKSSTDGNAIAFTLDYYPGRSFVIETVAGMRSAPANLIPEPSTATLSLLALTTLLHRRRRR